MKVTYFPDDIADAIAEIAQETDRDIIESAKGALYYLKAICENHYNDDYYRDFYRLLERMTEEAAKINFEKIRSENG